LAHRIFPYRLVDRWGKSCQWPALWNKEHMPIHFLHS